MWWYRHSRLGLPMTTSEPNQPQAWFHHELRHRPPWFAVCCRPVPDQYPPTPARSPTRSSGPRRTTPATPRSTPARRAASSWHPPRPLGTRPRLFSSQGHDLVAHALLDAAVDGRVQRLGEGLIGAQVHVRVHLGQRLERLGDDLGAHVVRLEQDGRVAADRERPAACAPPGCDLAKSVMSYTCACQGGIRREEASVSRGSASARARGRRRRHLHHALNRADCLRCRVVRETGRRVRRRLDRRARGATRTWPRIWVYWRSGSRPLPTGLGPAADALPPLPIAELCRGAGARVMRSRRRRGVFPSRSASNAEIFSSTIRAGRPSVTRENLSSLLFSTKTKKRFGFRAHP